MVDKSSELKTFVAKVVEETLDEIAKEQGITKKELVRLAYNELQEAETKKG